MRWRFGAALLIASLIMSPTDAAEKVWDAAEGLVRDREEVQASSVGGSGTLSGLLAATTSSNGERNIGKVAGAAAVFGAIANSVLKIFLQPDPSQGDDCVREATPAEETKSYKAKLSRKPPPPVREDSEMEETDFDNPEKLRIYREDAILRQVSTMLSQTRNHKGHITEATVDVENDLSDSEEEVESKVPGADRGVPGAHGADFSTMFKTVGGSKRKIVTSTQVKVNPQENNIDKTLKNSLITRTQKELQQMRRCLPMNELLNAEYQQHVIPQGGFTQALKEYPFLIDIMLHACENPMKIPNIYEKMRKVNPYLVGLIRLILRRKQNEIEKEALKEAFYKIEDPDGTMKFPADFLLMVSEDKVNLVYKDAGFSLVKKVVNKSDPQKKYDEYFGWHD